MRVRLQWTMLLAAGCLLGQAAWAGPSTSGSNTGGSSSSNNGGTIGVDAPSNAPEQRAKAEAAAKERAAQKLADMNSSGERRLRAIVIPAFKVDHAAARDVFKQIREQAKAADPDGNGFNLLFTCKAEALNTPITMDMNNVPVPDLLHFVSLAAGLDLKYEEHAVVVINHVPKP